MPVGITRFDDPTDNSAAAADSTSAAPGNGVAPNAFIPVTQPEKAASERFQWKPAFAQYSLEIAIQHGWRFAHEAGTRDATGYGPWFRTGSTPSAKPAAGMTATAGMPASSVTR